MLAPCCVITRLCRTAGLIRCPASCHTTARTHTKPQQALARLSPAGPGLGLGSPPPTPRTNDADRQRPTRRRLAPCRHGLTGLGSRQHRLWPARPAKPAEKPPGQRRYLGRSPARARPSYRTGGRRRAAAACVRQRHQRGRSKRWPSRLRRPNRARSRSGCRRPAHWRRRSASPGDHRFATPDTARSPAPGWSRCDTGA